MYLLIHFEYSKRGQADGVYSKTTSTGILRGHLTKMHRHEYIEACQKNGWQPKGAAAAIDVNETVFRRTPFTMNNFRKSLVEWMVGFDEVC